MDDFDFVQVEDIYFDYDDIYAAASEFYHLEDSE
jgi:hypothetical protein